MKARVSGPLLLVWAGIGVILGPALWLLASNRLLGAACSTAVGFSAGFAFAVGRRLPERNVP